MMSASAKRVCSNAMPSSVFRLTLRKFLFSEAKSNAGSSMSVFCIPKAGPFVRYSSPEAGSIL